MADTASDCLASLREDLQLLLHWAADNGLSFDPAKSELLHLTRRKARFDDNPDLALTLSSGHHWLTTATPRTESMRWLGVWFDRRLSFAAHVKQARCKALRAAGAIRGLGNTLKGASPAALRSAAVACVLPVLFYAAETWWPAPRPGLRFGPVAAIRRDVDTVLRATARAILPVWRTTPAPALYREAGLPPAQAWLDYISRRHALRLHRLDPAHPLTVRLQALPNIALPQTRLARCLELLPELERVTPDPSPPWHPCTSTSSLYQAVGYHANPRETQRRLFLEWLSRVPASDMVLFSDGSRLGQGHVGGGWVGYHQHQQVPALTGHGSFGEAMEVPDAEAYAALGALLTAQASPLLPLASAVHICLDNLHTAATAADDRASLAARSAQHIFMQIRQVASSLPIPVFFRWCPGHCKTTGNEAADLAARTAAVRPPVCRYPHTHAAARRRSRELFWSDAQAAWTDWLTHHPRTYSLLELRADGPPPELSLSRFALGHLLAIRSGHGDFADYHQRFQHDDAVLRCTCGSFKTPLHFFHCPLAPSRLLAGAPMQRRVSYILGTTKGAHHFAAWLTTSNFFTAICPRR